MDGEWEFVRRVKSGSSWHPATDNLSGTEEYGTYVNDPTIDSTFSKTWDNARVEYFLFATGDGTQWLVATKEAVLGSYYADEKRDIIMSSLSETATQAKWFYRDNQPVDPWISLVDHRTAGDGQMLYGESASSNHVSTIQNYNGVNVFIKYSNNLFNNF